MINVKKEIVKALKNIWFIIPCVLCSILAVIQCVVKSSAYCNSINELLENQPITVNYCLPINTAFKLWIGNDDSIYSKIFFNVAPLLAVLPYSWSYCQDFKKRITPKEMNDSKYYLSKFIAVFISSGFVVAVPLIINFIGITLFVPTVKPDSVYDIYYGIFSEEFLSSLFYKSPFLYVTAFILLNLIFSGLFGCLGLSFSTVVKNKVSAVIFPAIILTVIEFARRHLLKSLLVEISPLSFLYPAKSQSANILIVFSEIAVLLLVTLIFPITRGNKNEI